MNVAASLATLVLRNKCVSRLIDLMHSSVLAIVGCMFVVASGGCRDDIGFRSSYDVGMSISATSIKATQSLIEPNALDSWTLPADARQAVATLHLGGEPSRVELYDVETGQLLGRATPNLGVFGRPTLCKGGGQVLFEYHRVIYLWDVRQNRQIQKFPGHLDTVTSISCLPDGKRFISGSYDGHALLWDMEDPERELAPPVQHPHGRIYRTAVSPDGWLAALGDDTGHVVLWEVVTGRVLRRWPRLLDRWYADEDDDDSGTQIIDDRTGEPLDLSGPSGTYILGLAFFPDNRRLAVGTGDGRVIVFDLQTGHEIARHSEDELYYRSVDNLSVSPDGKRLLFTAGRLAVRLWDADQRRVVASFAGHTIVDSLPMWKGRPGGIMAAAFSPDGHRAVTCGEDGTVRVWQLPR